jgi:hypothetical protein
MIVESLEDYAEYLIQLQPYFEQLPKKTQAEMLYMIYLALKNIAQIAMAEGITLPEIPQLSPEMLALLSL